MENTSLNMISFYQLDSIMALPEEMLHVILSKLNATDLNTMCLVSKIFHRMANDPVLWRMKIKELNIKVWNENLGAKQEVKTFSFIAKDQYAFVERVIGPIGPTAFTQIPQVCFVHTKHFFSSWKPNSAIIHGLKWETYLHQYINFIAFSIVENKTNYKRAIIVKENPDSMTVEKQDYLKRLLNHEPCGIVTSRFKKNTLEEGDRFAIKRGLKGKRQRVSAVELCSPQPESEKWDNDWRRIISF